MQSGLDNSLLSSLSPKLQSPGPTNHVRAALGEVDRRVELEGGHEHERSGHLQNTESTHSVFGFYGTMVACVARF